MTTMCSAAAARGAQAGASSSGDVRRYAGLRPAAPVPRRKAGGRRRRGTAAAATASSGNGRSPQELSWDTISTDELEDWVEQGPPTPLLDTVNFPVHIKNFNSRQLQQLCKELRADLIHTVAKTGGHLGSSLGVVELTVALHHVFNTPEDKIIWDVGHQAYIHKMLTGRRDRMSTIRQQGGLSGFTKRCESVYDPFGAGHSSTSVSAAVGMAVGRDFKGRKNSVIAVIGDGAITGGMAYEAMNHAGFLDKNMIVSLPTQYNGKNQDPVGALSSALARLQSNRQLRELRELAKGVTKQLPDVIQNATAKIDEYARGMISGSGSTLFEELGFYYIGPVDGHNIQDLVDVLTEIKNTDTVGPVLLHVVSEKGRGYLPAETASDKMHGVVQYDTVTGQQAKSKAQSLTNYFADALTAEAARDSRIVGVHAAMGGGTGMTRFEKAGAPRCVFPERCFDVGIAEQHAVTFAAGLATEGMAPFCVIYSTFLQRGYDQVVHDVSLQNLPVRFAMDRAGLVVMAASDEAELINMVATAAAIDDRPSCFRFPRANGRGIDLAANGITADFKGTPLQIGKGVVRRSGTDVALVGYGPSSYECLAAAEMLEKAGVSATVVDARFCKPLDTMLIRQLAKEHPVMITVEEGAIGGFAAHVMQFLALEGLLDGGLKFRPMCLPDRYIEHGTQTEQLAEAGLTASHIAATVLKVMDRRGAPVIIASDVARHGDSNVRTDLAPAPAAAAGAPEEQQDQQDRCAETEATALLLVLLRIQAEGLEMLARLPIQGLVLAPGERFSASEAAAVVDWMEEHCPGGLQEWRALEFGHAAARAQQEHLAAQLSHISYVRFNRTYRGGLGALAALPPSVREVQILFGLEGRQHPLAVGPLLHTLELRHAEYLVASLPQLLGAAGHVVLEAPLLWVCLYRAFRLYRLQRNAQGEEQLVPPPHTLLMPASFDEQPVPLLSCRPQQLAQALLQAAAVLRAPVIVESDGATCLTLMRVADGLAAAEEAWVPGPELPIGRTEVTH
eukprot:scaffold8.g1616.t1